MLEGLSPRWIALWLIGLVVGSALTIWAVIWITDNAIYKDWDRNGGAPKGYMQKPASEHVKS